MMAAELISETEAEALADVVAAALETDAVIDLRVNRGDSDARFKRVSGRVVELKNKRLLKPGKWNRKLLLNSKLWQINLPHKGLQKKGLV